MTTVARAGCAGPLTGRKPGMPWLPLAWAVPWLVWAWLMRHRWSYDVEFYFGWAVPVLGGYLLWLRWEDRPAARDVAGGGTALALGGAVVLGVLIPVLTPNPLWTGAAWIAGIGALATTVGVSARAGGPAWARHFLAPFVFNLTALPWPAVVQTTVVAGLKTATATVAAEVISVLGWPAVTSGSAIEVGRGLIGIDDACSGVRALQAVVMAALFLGELRRFPWLRRVALLGAGILLALGANLGRTIFLVWQVARGGATAAHGWHDAAGEVELLGSLLALAGLAAWLGRKLPPGAVPLNAATARAPVAGAKLAGAVVALLAVAFVGTEAWYRFPWSAKSEPGLAWQLAAPDAQWRSLALPASLQASLQYDVAAGFTAVAAADGREWIALHFRWNRDPALRYLAGLHSPAICLPHVGAELDCNLGPQEVRVAGVSLRLEETRFRARGGIFYVFQGLWDVGWMRSLSVAENNAIDFAADRLRLVREHRRELALEQITIAVNGCRTDAEALALVRAMAPRLLQPRPE